MPPPKVARFAAAVSIVAALSVIAASVARQDFIVMAAALIGAAAGMLTLWAMGRQVLPAVPPRKRPDPAATVLLATLRNVTNGSDRLLDDLHRVLAGIVADERGKIDRVEPHSLVASFSRGDHPGAAVHAARRMLSNVDALSRRLGHELSISIAVHSGPRGEEAVGVAARIQEAATDAVPVLVSQAAAQQLGGQLERVDTVSADGWQLDVFTFPPAQKRLPGL